MRGDGIGGYKGEQHGTRYWYIHAACRCDDCRAANAAEQRRMTAARTKRLALATVSHGSAHTYGNWGCRCRPCVDAWNIYHRPYSLAWVARQKAKRSA